jgi:transposase InsO family protein
VLFNIGILKALNVRTFKMMAEDFAELEYESPNDNFPGALSLPGMNLSENRRAGQVYAHFNQRIAAFPRWLHGYNWYRLHDSFPGQPRLGLTTNNVLRVPS